jgi:hypothetical protein
LPPTYIEHGESPGSWIGSGLAGIGGLNVGDTVTAEQMKALFGAGLHPLANQRLEQLDAADVTDTSVHVATRPGAPFKIYSGEISTFPGRGGEADCRTAGCGRTARRRSDGCPRDRRHHR